MTRLEGLHDDALRSRARRGARARRDARDPWAVADRGRSGRISTSYAEIVASRAGATGARRFRAARSRATRFPVCSRPPTCSSARRSPRGARRSTRSSTRRARAGLPCPLEQRRARRVPRRLSGRASASPASDPDGLAHALLEVAAAGPDRPRRRSGRSSGVVSSGGTRSNRGRMRCSVSSLARAGTVGAPGVPSDRAIEGR